MVDLKEEEKRLQFLISRIDSEVEKFTQITELIERKQNDLQQNITKHGFEPLPIKIKPHSSDAPSLVDELQDHVAQLKQLKITINAKLSNVVKEEELDEALKKKYQNSAHINKTPSGDFEVIYSDPDMLYLYSEVMTGKKIANMIRDELMKIETNQPARQQQQATQ